MSVRAVRQALRVAPGVGLGRPADGAVRGEAVGERDGAVAAAPRAVRELAKVEDDEAVRPGAAGATTLSAKDSRRGCALVEGRRHGGPVADRRRERLAPA